MRVAVALFLLLTPPADPPPAGAARRIGAEPVYRLRFRADGKLLGVVAGRVLTWDPATGRQLARSSPLPDQSGEHPWLASVARDGSRVAYLASVSESRVHLFDLAAGHILASYDTDSRWPYPRLTAAGRLLVPKDGKITVCDPATGTELYAPHLPFEYSRAYDTTPDGRRLCVGGLHTGTLVVIDLGTGHTVAAYRTADAELTAAAVTPDGRTVVAAGGDGTLTAWDAATGRRLWGSKVVPQGPAYGGLMFPDGRTLAVTGEDRVIRLVELATGRVRQVFTGHAASIFSFDVSPDGRWVAAASSDAPVYLWDVRGGCEPAGPPPDAAGLARLWDDLESPDAMRAFRAARVLVRHPGAAVPFLRDRVRPTPGCDTAAVARRVADLDAPAFAVREAATRELKKLGELAEPTVRAALLDSSSAEVRARAGTILAAIPKPAGEPLRALRAVEVLEWAATPAAKDVLRTLAGGSDVAGLTREAKAALARLR